MAHSAAEIKRLQDKFDVRRFDEFYEITIIIIINGRPPVFPPKGPDTGVAEYAFTQAVLDNLGDVAGAMQRQAGQLHKAAELVVASAA